MEVVPMTHPDIAQALANAHRDDLLRAAASWRRSQVAHTSTLGLPRSQRLAAWLKGQLRRRPAAITTPAPAPRCATATTTGGLR
jgi:hypothetical protein